MSKFWTIERAQGAIKAAFFSRSILTLGDPEEVWLRFTEIQRAVSVSEGRIGDRTLSRALKALQAAGQLRKRAEGRASLYGLIIQPAEMLKSLARAEGSAVESEGAIGGWGDALEGWAVFGIPEVVPRRFQRRIRRECRRHQEEIRDVLYEIWDECLDAVLKPSQRRVSRSVFSAGREGILKIFEIQLLGVEGFASSSRLWRIVENVAPGTLSSFRKSIAGNQTSEIPIGEGIALLLSNIGAGPIEETRPQVEREMKRVQDRLQRAAVAFTPLWEALTPKEQERAGRRLQATSAMTASLTSVVHA